MMDHPEIAIEVDGQRINIATMDAAIAACMARLDEGRGFTFLTLNLDHMVRRRQDAAFRAAYARVDFVSADGQPVVTLANRAGAKITRTTGADIVLPLCRAAVTANASIYLFGTEVSTLEIAASKLKDRAPGLRIAGLEAPAMGFDPYSQAAEGAVLRIAQSGAKLCFVALPTLKQVQFMDRFSAQYPEIGFIGVGAAIDFIAGTQSRAPLFFQNNGIEWLWRLAQNPGQMAKRYLDCGMLYAKLRFFTSSSGEN